MTHRVEVELLSEAQLQYCLLGRGTIPFLALYTFLFMGRLFSGNFA